MTQVRSGIRSVLAALLALAAVRCVALPKSGSVLPSERDAVTLDPEDIEEIQIPIEGDEIIAPPDWGTYAHNPPSSGPHWDKPLHWGVYSEERPPAEWVNNLAHGGIVLLLDCPEHLGGCPELMASLEDWVTNDLPASPDGSAKVLAFPSSSATKQIVALAWGWQMELSEFDATALTQFYTRHVDQKAADQ